MKFTKTLLILVAIIALVFYSCSSDHSHDVSSEKSEAISINDQCKMDAKEFHKKLANQFAITPQSDSTFMHLVELDARYVIWKKSLVKLPGTECNHAPGEEHVHDHAAESALEKLSDEELLDLQKAIRSELDQIICDFNNILGEDC